MVIEITYRDIVSALEPDRVDSDFIGGVYGCPFTVRLKNNTRLTERVTNKFCMMKACVSCWDTPLDANEIGRVIDAYGSSFYLNLLQEKVERVSNEHTTI